MPRPSQKLTCKGLDVAHPVDRLPEGYFPILNNVRVSSDGEIVARQGTVTAYTPEANPVHSLRRLNDDTNSTAANLAGIGTKVYKDGALADSGYSGKPLSMIPFRPNRSPDSFMYIGDGTRLRKMRTDGTNFGVGIVPPAKAPKISLGVPNYEFIADFEIAAGWAATGTAGAITTPYRFNTTIAAIVYDTGSTGWCGIVPAAFDNNLQAGAKVGVNGVEATKITEVQQAITNTTILGISYDSGTTGACSVVLTDQSPNLVRNSLVTIGGETVRVAVVIRGQDNTTVSFRCTTAGAFAAGTAVTGNVSFRCYVGGTYAATQTLICKVFASTITKGVGAIQFTGAKKLDVITPSGTGGRPVSGDDYIHISILMDTPSALTEGRIILDTSDGTFTKGFYYKPFRSNDLTPNVTGSLTYITNQQTIQARQILDPQPTSNSELGIAFQELYTVTPAVQAVSGNSQWTEYMFKVSDLIRVGSDQTTSLANIVAIGVQFSVTASVQVLLGSWWIGGTYGLDVIPAESSMQWAYRYRDSRTGAKSNPSPATLSGLEPQREAATITVVASADAQVDSIDILRFGGGLDRWKVVGTFPNSSATVQDSLSTLFITTNEDGVTDDYQPYPISDLPRTGTCSVVGTSVTRLTGDNFNLNWVPGSLIVINGLACTLYGSPLTTSSLRIVQSVGVSGSTTFQLPEPTIAATPLPALWSIGGQGIGTYQMGVGDPYNPGFLRWCKGNDPDAASDKGNLEITSPSEPLMNGCEYDGRGFVFSTDRLFSLFPNFGTINYNGVGETLQAQNGNQFTAQVVVSNNGLFGRYAMCVTPSGIAWVGKDGIYLWSGGTPKSLTDLNLYPLFPHAGVSSSVNGYNPPDYTQPDSLRLSFADNSLFFMYLDTGGVRQCLRFDFAHMGWFPYTFTPTATLVYALEGKGLNTVLVGASNGAVSTLSGTGLDNGTPIACHVRTPSVDGGDSRADKHWGDMILDAAAPSAITCIPGFNNHLITLPPVSFALNPRNQQIIELDQYYRNISLDLAWTGPASLYEWQPEFTPQPDTAKARPTDWENGGLAGEKYIQGVRLHAKGAANITIQYYDAAGVLHNGPVISINHPLEETRLYTFTPFATHLMRFVGDNSWQYFGADWIFHPTKVAQEWDNGGQEGAKYIQGVRLRASTGGAASTVTIEYYDDNGAFQTGPALAVNHQLELVKAYSFTPFIGHLMRFNPSGVFDLINAEWIYEPMPEQGTLWQTQSTTHDLPGYQHFRWLLFAYMSTAAVTITATSETSTWTLTVPSTNGLYLKTAPMLVPPVKGLAWSYSITSANPCRVFKRDCELYVKAWGDPGPFRVVNPFGDIHRISGAKI